jgi:hypothetical protein
MTLSLLMPEPRESPQTVEEEPERAEPRPATGGTQEGARRPPLRRPGPLCEMKGAAGA